MADSQWFANYADGYDRVQSVEYMAENDAHASMYRDLYAMAQKDLARLSKALTEEIERRTSAEADRRRMLQMLLGYMTTMTVEERKADQTFTLRAQVSGWLLAQAREDTTGLGTVLHEIAATLARQAEAEISKSLVSPTGDEQT